MPKPARLCLLLFFLLGLVFLSTLSLDKPDRSSIPFATSRGVEGNMDLVIPGRAYVGDRAELSVAVRIDDVDPADERVLIARFESGLAQLDPAGEVSVNFTSSAPILLRWSFRPMAPEVYSATLWIWLSENGDRELLLAREMEIEARDWLTVPVAAARVTTALLAAVALLGVVYFSFRRRFSAAT